MGDKYGRAMFLKEYASYIKDSMINELTSLNRTMMLSIDVIPVPTDEAVREDAEPPAGGGDQRHQLAAAAEQQQQLLRGGALRPGAAAERDAGNAG